ncbi:MAG: murein biosynthesis integral membrane protein MurJ [Spirochaetia bacterium]|nr:murein biosynthesis integral membrane protein MurJ [Spirochaetia bacterium]
MQDSTQDKAAAKSSVIVMLCTLTSRVLGIVRARVIGSIFGSSGTADVINFTFNIPNNFRKIFAEGAINASIIPFFSRLIDSDDSKATKRLFALLVTYQTLILLPLVLVSYLYGEPLLAFFSDFDGQQLVLGARLLPFFMVYLLTISIGSIFNGLLHCHKSFFHSHAAPLLFSFSVIFGVQFLHPYFGAMSMAYSALVGGLLQGSYSYLVVRRYGYRMRLAFDTKGTLFKPLMKSWVQMVFSSVIVVIAQMVAFWFASSLSEGSVTAFSNSLIFWQAPYGIFFNAIVAVSFPLMSRSYGLGRLDEMQKVTREALINLLTFLLPSTILLFALSRESVSAILQTGNYTLADSNLTALILRYYLLGMTSAAFFSLLQRVGYSAGRHRTMTQVTAFMSILDIALMWLFIRGGYGIIALPLASIVSFSLSFILLAYILRDLYPIHKDKALFKGVLRVLVANIPLLAFCILYSLFDLRWYETGSTLVNFCLVALLGGVGVAVTLLSYNIANIPFLRLLRPKR